MIASRDWAVGTSCWLLLLGVLLRPCFSQPCPANAPAGSNLNDPQPYLRIDAIETDGAQAVLHDGEDTIGPATGGGVDRVYNDGFVRVDSFGNLGGVTVFWGYSSSGQYDSTGDGAIRFHKKRVVDPATVLLVTDTYSLFGGVPPSAPYEGSFAGFGPLLSDSPTRSVQFVSRPSGAADTTNGVWISWGSQSNRLYAVQHASDLTTGFTNLAEHILSTPPENFFLDATATNGPLGFYRIKVE
jgi:hypothetical protein